MEQLPRLAIGKVWYSFTRGCRGARRTTETLRRTNSRAVRKPMAPAPTTKTRRDEAAAVDMMGDTGTCTRERERERRTARETSEENCGMMGRKGKQKIADVTNILNLFQHLSTTRLLFRRREEDEDERLSILFVWTEMSSTCSYAFYRVTYA